MLEGQIERLFLAGFQLLPAEAVNNHYVLERDGFVVLVEKCPDGALGSVGSAGILVEGSFAVLIWKREVPIFVAKGKEVPATADQVEALRRFDADLKTAVG